jgi:capsular polysaccharide transport system ATP-binding protein
LIKLQNVTKFYETKNKKNILFENYSFELPSDKNIAILGRNGTGKSTLLRLLGGIEEPNSGKIISNKKFSWPMALARGFQGSLSGNDNVKFVARIYGKNNAEIKKIIKFVFDYCELDDYFFMPVKTYSSGMRAKLSFALSLAFDFEVFLIDETFAVGDKHFKRKSFESIKHLSRDRSIIMVSHDMQIVRELCSCILLLNNNELTYFDDIHKGIAAYNQL